MTGKIRLLLVVAGLGGALTVAIGWILSTIILYPSPFPCTDPNEQKLYVYCGTPGDLGLPYEEVEFRSVDGLKLRGWYIPAPSARRVVIVAHGGHAGKWAALRYLVALHKAKLNVLAFDFRNHGQSEGTMTTTGFYERKDLAAAVDFALSRRNTAVGVYGFSMGAATAILSMAEDRRIAAGIFESPFADFGELVAEAGGARYGLPRFPLVSTALWFFEKRSGASLDSLRPISAIGRIAPRPVLLIHGTQDPVIPVSHSQRLFAAAGRPKRFWSVPGGTHVNSWNVDRARAEKEVAGFFEAHLRSPNRTENSIPSPKGNSSEL